MVESAEESIVEGNQKGGIRKDRGLALSTRGWPTDRLTNWWTESYLAAKKKRRTRGALDLKMNCVLNVTTRQLTANQNDALIESHTDYFIYLTFTQKWWKHKYSQKQSHASSFKSYNGNNLLLEVRKEKAGKKPEAQRDQLSWFRNRHKKLADENHQDSGVVS